MNHLLRTIFSGVVEGDRESVRERVGEAIDDGIPAGSILNEGLIAAMAEVGRRFEAGEYYVPEMLISARAMKEALSLLRPLLTEANVQTAGRVIAGTVQGDLHDIGKNLVSMMLEGAGFEIVDLGTDVPPERFVEAVRRGGVDLLAMSALLTTTMPQMRATIKAIEEAGLRNRIKIMVGGAPITEEYAWQIRADGYAADASRAVAVARSLMAKSVAAAPS